MIRVPSGSLAAALFFAAAFLASPVAAEKGKVAGKISLTVTSIERMQQYPPPPNVFVVCAGVGYEMAVITLKVTGSTTFEDYKMSASASMVDADGTSRTAVLSKPFKAGYQPEVWDKQVLVFNVKKDLKLKLLSVGDMSFDLTKIAEK